MNWVGAMEKTNGVDLLRLKAGVIKRELGGILCELDVGLVWMMMFELRLTDADHRNGFPSHRLRFLEMVDAVPLLRKTVASRARGSLGASDLYGAGAVHKACRTASAAFTRPAREIGILRERRRPEGSIRASSWYVERPGIGDAGDSPSGSRAR